MNFDKILQAHYRTKLATMLWGSSGYGKSSLVADYANRNNYALITLHAQYLDPLSLFIPSIEEMSRLGYAKYYPSEAVHGILQASVPTVLFLDELTRARDDTFNVLTELLLERRVFGYKVPDHVQIIAASNFAEEDSGVRDLPDAVMNRLTHLIHAPNLATIRRSLRYELSRRIIQSNDDLVALPGNHDILSRLTRNPRQIDACALLAVEGLRKDELMAVCRGRVGLEAGTQLAVALQREIGQVIQKFPATLAYEDFERLGKLEREGSVLDTIQLLKNATQKPEQHRLVADYLLFYASPETCRAVQMFKFQFTFKDPPQLNGTALAVKKDDTASPEPLTRSNAPWQWYAVQIQKLAPR